jgi:hypothetical protein
MHIFANACTFGRGVSADDGEDEDVDHVQQHYSINSFHGAAAGRGREKAMGSPLSGSDEQQPCARQGNVPFELGAILQSP